LQYRREIDGLRSLAVIPVIFFHAGFDSFLGGFVGVDIFFVISGYLITSIILTELGSGSFTLVGFYERRARRILPALVFVTTLCLPFAYLWMYPKQLVEFSHSVVAVSAFASNFLFFSESGYFGSAAELKPLLHTWSLAVEEQYYVVFPLFMVIFWRLGKRPLVALISIVAFLSMFCAQWAGNFNFSAAEFKADWQWFNQPTWASFYLPVGRVWEFMIGALTAFYLQSRPHPAGKLGGWAAGLGVVLIVFAIASFRPWTPFPSIYTLVPTLGTALIILCATSTTAVGRLLSLPIFVGIGLISYSAYLFHQPLFAFARIRSIYEPGALAFLLLSGIALALGALSWRFIERPFRDRRKFSPFMIFLGATLASTLMIAVGLAGHFGEGFRGRFHDEVYRVLEYGYTWRSLPDSCDPGKGPYSAPDARCTVGTEHEPSIAIVGDSHARAIAPTFGKYAKKLGLSAKVLVHSGCPPTHRSRKQLKPGGTCPRNNEEVYTYLAQNSEIEFIVLMARWTKYLQPGFDNGEGSNWASEEYQEGILRLLSLGRTVFLVYPVPEMERSVPRHLSRLELYNIVAEHPLSEKYSHFKTRTKAIKKAFDAIGDIPNLVRIRPEYALCNTFLEDHCVGELEGLPLYVDDNHLGEAGAALVISDILKHIENVAYRKHSAHPL
jgi:peptidoglycan/LPS O-acetylase OafA/YrhL